MAVIETWFNQDLQQPVKVHYLNGSLFSHNGNGNRIGVHVFNNGTPVTLAGTVSGYVVTADGSTVPCTGSRSGNNASILIPAAAYQPGAVFITVFLTDGNTVTTLASVATNVLQARTNNQVSPGSVVTDWTQTINAAMLSVQDAAANLGHIVATPYESITFPVPVGKYTYYDGNLYRCIVPIATSENFTASHWKQVPLGDDVAELRNATAKSKNLLPVEAKTTVQYDVNRQYSDGVLVSSNTANTGGGRNYPITPNFDLPAGKYTISKTVVSGAKRSIYIVNANNTSTYYQYVDTDDSATFTLPAGTYFLSMGYSANVAYNLSYKLQLEAGETAHAFENPSYITAVDLVARSGIETLETEKADNEDVADVLEYAQGVNAKVQGITGTTKNLFQLDGIIIGTNASGTTGYPKRATTIPYTGGSNQLTVSVKTLPSNLKYEVDGYTDANFGGLRNISSGWVTAAGSSHTLPTNSPYCRILFGSVDDNNLTDADFAGLEMQIEVGTVKTNYVPHETAVDYVARESNLFPVKLRVCSYNVGEYSYGIGSDTPAADALDNLIAFLSANNFDTIGIQEGRTLVNGTNVNDTVFADYFNAQVNKTNSVATKSLFSLYETGEGAFTADSRPYVYGKANIGGKEVYIMSVHLGLTASVRDSNYTELLAILAQHERFIVFGDFNAANEFSTGKAEQAQAEYNKLINAGYTVANGGRWGLMSTFHTTNYLDNICVSSNIKMISASVLDVYDEMNSDHLPLVAELVV